MITELVPRGPIVLVGHSLGGMAIMELADAKPELFGKRVKGVVLIATSSGKLARSQPGAASPRSRSYGSRRRCSTGAARSTATR